MESLRLRPPDQAACANCDGYLKGEGVKIDDAMLLVTPDGALWFCSWDCLAEVAHAYVRVADVDSKPSAEIHSESLAEILRLDRNCNEAKVAQSACLLNRLVRTFK